MIKSPGAADQRRKPNRVYLAAPQSLVLDMSHHMSRTVAPHGGRSRDARAKRATACTYAAESGNGWSEVRASVRQL